MRAFIYVKTAVFFGVLCWVGVESFKQAVSLHRPLGALQARKNGMVEGGLLKTATLGLAAALMLLAQAPGVNAVEDQGANDTSNTKIKKGGASTLQRGITKTITRGVLMDRSDFSNQQLRGVAFQQSIVRDCDFSNSDLRGASFFDATLDGSNFEGADLTQVNLELAQLKRTNLKNAIAKELYTVGTTNFDGIASIENADFTDTEFDKFQRKYLCGLDSAKGVNPKTGVDTRESLRCD